MKAIVITRYGEADVLELQEVELPTPKEDEVLIKVHAASVNDWELGLMRGNPYFLRLLYQGFFKPAVRIPGVDVAGTVEAVGKNVLHFKPGDEVFGDLSESGFGSFAEYTCAKATELYRKPGSMSFEVAAALPHAGALAVQGLIDLGRIEKRKTVLINGAGGGVGTIGLQIARQYDVELTGVDSADKLERLLAQGFDQVIDYRKEDITQNGKQYDLVLDVKTNRSIFKYTNALKPGGAYVTVGGALPLILQTLLLRPFIKRTQNKDMQVLALKPNKDLAYLSDLYESGKLMPHLDRSFKLEEVPEAIQYFAEARHQGKIIIRIPQ